MTTVPLVQSGLKRKRSREDGETDNFKKERIKHKNGDDDTVRDAGDRGWNLTLEQKLLLAKESKETRESKAPCAYMYSSLSRRFWHFLKHVDIDGKRILNDEEITRITEGKYKTWKPKHIQWGYRNDFDQFSAMILKAIPDFDFRSQARGERILKPRKTAKSPPHTEERTVSVEQELSPTSSCLHCRKAQSSEELERHEASCLRNPTNMPECRFCGKNFTTTSITRHERRCQSNVINNKNVLNKRLSGQNPDARTEQKLEIELSNGRDPSIWNNDDDNTMARPMFTEDLSCLEIDWELPRVVDNAFGVCNQSLSAEFKSSEQRQHELEVHGPHQHLSVIDRLEDQHLNQNKSFASKQSDYSSYPELEILISRGDTFLNSFSWKPKRRVEHGNASPFLENQDSSLVEGLHSWTNERLLAALEDRGVTSSSIRLILKERFANWRHEVVQTLGERRLLLSQAHDHPTALYPTGNDLVKLIALELVSTEEFHESMGGTVLEPKSFKLSEDWLRNLSIPGISENFQSFDNWLKKEFKKNNLEVKIVALAQSIYHELPQDMKIQGLSNVTAYSPMNAPTTSLREDIYRYHELRRRLLGAAKQFAQHAYELQKQLRCSSGHDQSALHKIRLLHNAERECRTRLSNTLLERSILTRLDGLISNFQDDELVHPSSFAQLREHAHITFQRATNHISDTYGFKSEKLLPLLNEYPFKSIKKERFDIGSNLPNKLPADTNLLERGSFASIDERLVKSLRFPFDGIDVQRFKTNMRYLLSIKGRPSSLKESLPLKQIRYGRRRNEFLQSSDLSHSERLYDNIFHARSLLEILIKENEDTESSENSPFQSKVNKAWFRMLGMIAISYGLLDEPAHILSASDVLLGHLRSIFSYEVQECTISMAAFKVVNVRFASIGSQKPEFAFQESKPFDRSVLTKHHRNHLLMAEIGRFFRGSLISAHIATMSSERFPRSVSQARTRLESLLQWTRTCSAPECKRLLDLADNYDKRAIAIGIRDSRQGTPQERAAVSTDRLDAYDCLSAMSIWSHATGPWFLFFANLYHPYCKAERGKWSINHLI